MKLNLLSLFSGCGGMDIGFEGGFKLLKNHINKDLNPDWIEHEDEKYITLKKNNIETIFANDIIPQAKIAWSNYFNQKYNEERNHIYTIDSIVNIVKDYKEGNKNALPKEVDIVTGGFPCQDFSVSGKRKGFSSHKDHNGRIIDSIDIPSEETRGKLYMWMKEVIEITKPKIFIAENVKGLANLGEVKDIIQKDFSSIDGDGYFVLDPKVLHAGNYGIAQSRERIFFIGIKKSELNRNILKNIEKLNSETSLSPYPQITHKLDNKLFYIEDEDKLKQFVNSGYVLHDLDEPNLSEDISQKFYSKAKFMGIHCQGQKELDFSKLAPTIRAEHHGNIEFRRLSLENGGKKYDELNAGKKERRLTLRECARIQTFPDDFNFVIPKNENLTKFEVSPSIAYKLVGNAVPPLLAYHISRKILSNWDLYFK